MSKEESHSVLVLVEFAVWRGNSPVSSVTTQSSRASSWKAGGGVGTWRTGPTNAGGGELEVGNLQLLISNRNGLWLDETDICIGRLSWNQWKLY